MAAVDQVGRVRKSPNRARSRADLPGQGPAVGGGSPVPLPSGAVPLHCAAISCKQRLCPYTDMTQPRSGRAVLLILSMMERSRPPAPIRAPLHAGGQDGPGHGDGGGGDLRAQEPRSGPRTRRSGTRVYTPHPRSGTQHGSPRSPTAGGRQPPCYAPRGAVHNS